MSAPDPGSLDATHAVVTPEYVEFRFPLAVLYSRFLAWLLDQLLTFSIAILIVIALSIALHEIGHLLGLDHTGDQANVMAPRVRVRDLSDADRATVRLLYSVPAGRIATR